MRERAWGWVLVLLVTACGPSAGAGDPDGGPGPVPDGGSGPGGPDAFVNQTCDPGLANPSPEICDSYDNDCNGMVDDGLAIPNPEGCGTMRCYYGEWRMGGDDVAANDELCNNHDDDCDGAVDEDLGRADPADACRHQTCTSGTWVDDTPATSATDDCDGIDNDCDGQVDEDYDPSPCFASCGGGFPTVGIEACLGGEVVCQPSDFPISLEICNGRDDDCDGFVDEGIPPRPCACGTGDEICSGGRWTGPCGAGCVLGATRWCDDPMYCHWGQQTCVTDPDGATRWGTCMEVTTTPPGCGGVVYDTDCCVASGECCQDAFGTWESTGNCAEECM